MKKSILITSLIVITISAVLYYIPANSGKLSRAMAEPTSSANTWESLDLQASGISVPPELPTTIDDPLLLAGWVYLYNQEETFPLWDGRLLSGRMLAEYVLDEQVRIVWGTEDICNGRSCSPRPICSDEACAQVKFVDPIYIASSFKDIPESEIMSLVEQLAHEIFHRSLPFGAVDDTLFEEYWAFYVAMQVAQSNWADFESYDSTYLACLTTWFMQHKLMVYAEIEAYPVNMIDSVNLDAPNCPIGPGGEFNINAIIANGQ